MCGIFGFTIESNSNSNQSKLVQKSISSLFRLSESRGKEAAGLACSNLEGIWTYKEPVSASQMLNGPKYQLFVNNFLRENNNIHNESATHPIAAIGHSRLVTNGNQLSPKNNQPVRGQDMVGVHNGIIVNSDALWKKYPHLNRESEVDTEIFIKLLEYYQSQKNDIVQSLKQVYAQVQGTISMALLSRSSNILILTTNHGSIYYSKSTKDNNYFFASEQLILEKFFKKNFNKVTFGQTSIQQLKPLETLLINLNDYSSALFNNILDNSVSSNNSIGRNLNHRHIFDASPENYSNTVPKQPIDLGRVTNHHFDDQWLQNHEHWVQTLRRCTKCILPETMPFIRFDSSGVCNYCLNYKQSKRHPYEELEKIVNALKHNDSSSNCIVSFSGGRDSSYGLHYIKKVLGLSPVAYTYDWGMITDLARRNQARLCGKLGIEHIIVSADIAKKRRYIQKNVLAWLKKPTLGMIPLFMAGDKQYFYYANLIAKTMSIKTIILCSNVLETTDFKKGFAEVPPLFQEDYTKFPSIFNTWKLVAYYAKQYASNLAYFNESFFDTALAYMSYYVIPHNYFNLFQYVPWKESEVNHILTSEYDWELAKDTNCSWRIGDGTAPFYNFVYYLSVGFTEHDTFRSNQIRENIISRDEALSSIQAINQPRLESLEWYFRTIGIEFNYALTQLHKHFAKKTQTDASQKEIKSILH